MSFCQVQQISLFMGSFLAAYTTFVEILTEFEVVVLEIMQSELLSKSTHFEKER